MSLNRARHRLCPRSITVLGIGVTEIIRSIRQSQFAFRVRRVFFTVSPAGALAGGGAAVGILRITLLHDEVGAGDCSVQHHILARHGEGHGRPVAAVAAVAVAIADGLAVQAENVSVGGDGHGGVFVRVEVPCRAGRSIRVQRAFAVHLAYTAIRYGDVVGTGQVCVPVEYAAEYFAAVVLRQARRKGSTRDRSVVVVHCPLKGSARDRSAEVVCHFSIEGSTGDGAFVCHTARALEGAARDFSVAVVCHLTFKGAFLDGAFVCHATRALEGAARDFSVAVVCHLTFKGAVLDGAAVCHTAREGSTRDFSGGGVCHGSIEDAARDRSVDVFHCPIEGAAGDRRSRTNLALHRLCGTEIKRSTIQTQYAVAVIVLPDVAVAVAAAIFAAALGADRVAIRADDEVLGGACCKGPQGEHGEHHAQCQDQAENAFFHWGRPPLLPKAARSFVSGSIIP